MSKDINEVRVVGELDETPEVRTTRSGTKVANPTIITRRGWTGKDGSERSSVEYHRVVCWAGLAERAADAGEGARIQVKGRLQTRSWEDDSGEKRWRTEIVAADFKVVEPAGHSFSEDALLGADDDLPF